MIFRFDISKVPVDLRGLQIKGNSIPISGDE